MKSEHLLIYLFWYCLVELSRKFYYEFHWVSNWVHRNFIKNFNCFLCMNFMISSLFPNFFLFTKIQSNPNSQEFEHTQHKTWKHRSINLTRFPLNMQNSEGKKTDKITWLDFDWHLQYFYLFNLINYETDFNPLALLMQICTNKFQSSYSNP